MVESNNNGAGEGQESPMTEEEKEYRQQIEKDIE